VAVRGVSLVLGVVLMAGLVVGGCSSSSPSTAKLTSHQATVTPCSLLSSAEASKLLGGHLIGAPVDDEGLCVYTGPSGSDIAVQPTKLPPQPACSAHFDCFPLPQCARIIKVDGVLAEWVPAGCIGVSVPPTTTRPPSDPFVNGLSATNDGYLVAIFVQRVSRPESVAEAAMVFSFRSLNRILT
jgi:hypothetical protein